MSIDIAIKFARLPHGLIYYYQHWIPHKPRALVVFLHGLGDHSGRYGEFLKSFVEKGCACAAYDQRGHGRSQGKRGHIRQFADWVEDVASFVQFSLSKLPQDTPLFIVGHSLGALIGISYLLTHSQPVQGMVALSTPLDLKMSVPWWKRELSKKFHGILPILTVDNCIKAEYLSRDMLEVEALLADSLCHNRLSIRAGYEIMKNLDKLGGLPDRIHVPFLMLAGSRDQVCDPNASVWFTAGLAAEDKKCHVYPGMQHDLLHDIGKEKVMDDIVDWIMGRASRVEHTGDQFPLNQREALWENISQPAR